MVVLLQVLHSHADNTTLGLEEDPPKWEIQIEGVEYVTTENTNILTCTSRHKI